MTEEKKLSRGYMGGTVVTLIASVLAAVIAFGLSLLMMNAFFAALLGLVTFMATICFGWTGLREIPVGSKAIQLTLGKRTTRIYPEGWIWNWPEPLGDIAIVDVRVSPIDLPVTEVLTADNVPVRINLSLQFSVIDIGVFLDAKDPETSLKNATESDIRTLAQKFNADKIAQEKSGIIAVLTSGETGPPGSPLEQTAVRALVDAPEKWGVTVSAVNITEIRLPEEIEEARTEIQVAQAQQAKERAQAISERTETENVAELIRILMRTGLTATEAVNVVQSERGKAKRVIIDGNASPLAQLGVLAGNFLGNQGQQATEGGDQPKGEPTGTPQSPRRRQPR